MNSQAAQVYAAAVNSMEAIIPGLKEWADTLLEGSERAEALFHINHLANDWHDLTLAIADHNGSPLA